MLIDCWMMNGTKTGVQRPNYTPIVPSMPANKGMLLVDSCQAVPRTMILIKKLTPIEIFARLPHMKPNDCASHKGLPQRLRRENTGQVPNRLSYDRKLATPQPEDTVC